MGDFVWTGRTSDGVTLTGTLIAAGLHIADFVRTSNWTPSHRASLGPASVSLYCVVRSHLPGDPPNCDAVIEVHVAVSNGDSGVGGTLDTIIGNVYYGRIDGMPPGEYILDGSMDDSVSVPFTLTITGLKLYKRYTDAIKPEDRAYVVAARDILGETVWAGDDITATSVAAGLTGVCTGLTYDESRYFYFVGGEAGAKWYGHASFPIDFEAKYFGGVRLNCTPDANLSAYAMTKWCDFTGDGGAHAGATPYPTATPYTGFYTTGTGASFDLYQDAAHSPHVAANIVSSSFSASWPAKVTVVLECRDCDTPLAADFDVTGHTTPLASGSHLLYIDPLQDTSIALNHDFIQSIGLLHENDLCAIEAHGKGSDDVEDYDCGAFHIRHLPELSIQKPNGSDEGATGFPSEWTVAAGSTAGTSIVNDWPSGETRITIPAGGSANIERSLYSTYDDINAGWAATGFAWEGTYKWMKRWPAATSHNVNGNGDDLWNHENFRWYGLKLKDVPNAQSIAMTVQANDVTITDSHELPEEDRRDAYEFSSTPCSPVSCTFSDFAAGTSEQVKVATYRDWNATKGYPHVTHLLLSGFTNTTGVETTIVLSDLALGIYDPATGYFGNDLPSDFDCAKVKLAFPHCTKTSPFVPLEFQACITETQGMPGTNTPDHMQSLGYERPGIDTTTRLMDPETEEDTTADRGIGGIWGDINASEGWEVAYSSTAYDAAFKGPALTAPHADTYMLDGLYGFGFKEQMMLPVSTSLRNMIARPRCGAFGAAGATNVTLKVIKRVRSGAEGCVALDQVSSARVDVYEKTGEGVDDYRLIGEYAPDTFGYWASDKGANHRGGTTSDSRDADRFAYKIDAVKSGANVPSVFTWPGDPYDVLYKWFEVAFGAGNFGFKLWQRFNGHTLAIGVDPTSGDVYCKQSPPSDDLPWIAEGRVFAGPGWSYPTIVERADGSWIATAQKSGVTHFAVNRMHDTSNAAWVEVTP